MGIRGIVRIDYNRCNGCKRCVELCPVHALEVVDGLPRPINSKCIACFGCVVVCSSNAITVEIDKSSYSVVHVEIYRDRQATLNSIVYTHRVQERQPSSQGQSG